MTKLISPSIARPVQLVLLTMAAAAGSYSRTTMGPLQEVIRESLALNDTQVALLQGVALAVPMALIAVPLGLLIDRYVRVRLICLLVIVSLLGTLLTAFAPGFAGLFLARCLVGLTAFSIPSVAVSLIADLFAPAQRGRATMVMALGQMGGVSGAFALGGLLSGGSTTDPMHWRWELVQMSAPFLLVICTLPALREPPRTELAVKNTSTRQALSELWSYRGVVIPLLSGVVIEQIAAGAALVWAPPTLSRNFKIPPDQVGAIMAAVVMVSGLTGSFLGGFLADQCQRRGGARRTMLALSGLALLGIPAALFGVMPEVPLASLLLGVQSSEGMLIAIMATALSTVVIPNELRGLCTTILSAASLLVGLAFAPISVSMISSSIGGPSKIGVALAIVGSVTSVFGAIAFALGARHLARIGERHAVDESQDAVAEMFDNWSGGRNS